MPLSTMLAPFAQKYVLKEGYLGNRPRFTQRFVIDCDLTWHWNVREDPLMQDVSHNFGTLIRQKVDLYHPDQARVVKTQPMWNLDDPSSNADEDGEPIEDNVKLPRTLWRFEQLAYYVPAHRRSADQYGIHLTSRGIAHVADQVHGLCSNQPREIVQIAAAYMLFAHELCHAWFEDIVCLVDFATGEKSRISQRRYATTQMRYHGYIFMEEALCNTAAFGWLQNFLKIADSRMPTGMPGFDPSAILGSFERWMRAQPRGYRDFSPITQPPYKCDLFVRNVARLLIAIYGLCAKGRSRPWYMTPGCDEIRSVIEQFFGGDLDPKFSHFVSHDKNRWDSFWAGEPPIHGELANSNLPV